MTAGDAALVSLLTACLTALLVGPSAAYLTTWLSLRRYQVEKWWDKKSVAYEETLGSLHDIIRYYDATLEAHVLDLHLTDAYKAKLESDLSMGRAKVGKMARLGSFILSQNAETILSKYEADIDGSSAGNDWFDHIDTSLYLSLKAFRALRDEARRDLGVGPALPGATWFEARVEKIKNRPGHPDLGAPEQR